ncbi:MAG: DoxX family protein [Deltaproteobacteria bacterium]|nr:DoxX family protein [Deltaproteobacteria bacterium]
MALLTTVIARILFSIPFLVFGSMHFMMPEKMVMVVPAWVPGGGLLWVYVIGACILAAGVSIVTKKFGTIACPLLAALLMTFVVTIHIPGLMNPEMMAMAMTAMLKDIGLAGGALTWAGIFAKEAKK